MAEMRKRAANAPKAPATHKEPVDLDRIDTDVLSIHGVARLLFCSLQAVRNIPADELPRYIGPGRSRLYLREDVMRYLKGVRRRTPAADDLMREIVGRGVDSISDSGRKHCKKEYVQ